MHYSRKTQKYHFYWCIKQISSWIRFDISFSKLQNPTSSQIMILRWSPGYRFKGFQRHVLVMQKCPRVRVVKHIEQLSWHDFPDILRSLLHSGSYPVAFSYINLIKHHKTSYLWITTPLVTEIELLKEMGPTQRLAGNTGLKKTTSQPACRSSRTQSSIFIGSDVCWTIGIFGPYVSGCTMWSN